MMDKEIFIEKMKTLAAGKLAPDEWFAWWKTNEDDLSNFLNLGEFRRIKPISHDFIYVIMLASQKGAVKYLEENQIDCEKSTVYLEKYKQEEDNYCKLQKKKEKELLNILKEENADLFNKFPKFAQSLKYIFSENDQIKSGVSFEQIEKSDIKLPEEIKSFFGTVAKIYLEGISIDFDDLYMLEINGKSYCVLGEFWKEADGDLLLLDISKNDESTAIYYYAHEENRVKLLRNSIVELMEKEFVKYIKS